ncbi:MAG: tetratricopeptide repeat protein [Pirellulaceae bacterium]
MPADPQIQPPPSRTSRQVQRPPRWFPWTSLMLVTGLFLGIYAFLEAPREVGRWHMAAAREFWRNAEYGEIQGNLSQVAENRQKALAKLEDALKWSPEEPTFILQRVEWRTDAAQYDEALRDCNHLIEKLGEEGGLLQERATILHLLGRHAEAVADAQRIDNLSKTSGMPSRANALNGLAYAKAIGKIDLESALKEVNEALTSQRNAAYLDTRGFIYYQMGKYELALKDFDPAANEIADRLKIRDAKSGLEGRTNPDIRKYEIDTRKLNKMMIAPIFYHRALAHEKLGHAAAAAADRKRVRELIGREGDEKLF